MQPASATRIPTHASVRIKAQNIREKEFTGYGIERADFVQVGKRENEFVVDGYTSTN